MSPDKATPPNFPRSTELLLLLMGFVLVAMFPRVITGSETFFHRDFGLFTYPVAQYQRECFMRGEVPLWNPYNDFGVPFLAQWNTSSLYPPILFYLVLPLPWSLAIFNLAHLVFAGLGMHLLARRWTGNGLAAALAGLAFAFNGLSWHMLMWVSNLAAYAWMPWVVLAAERAWREGGRRIIVAALAGAMQMLSGAPEIIALTWLFAGALCAMQWLRCEGPRGRMALRFAVVILLVAGLSAAQLLPFADLLAHSHRDTGYDGSAWAMPQWGWANFIVPLFHCSPSILGVYSQNEQQWASSYYAGIGVLTLALLAPGRRRDVRVWLLVAAAIAGLLLSMGERGELLAAAKWIFPSVGVMRYPIKLIILTLFALPLLAAFGLNELQRAVMTLHGRVPRRVIATGVVMLLVLAGILMDAHAHPRPDDQWSVTFESGWTRALFLLLMLGVACWFAAAQSSRARTLGGVALLLLVALDAMTHTANQNPTVTTEAYGPLDIGREVPARNGDARAMVHPQLQVFLQHGSTTNSLAYYLGVRSALFMDCNLPEHIPTASGFFSLYLRDSFQVESLLNRPNQPIPEPLADFIGGSQISSPEMPVSWTNRSTHMPLVTGGQAPVFATPEETLKALVSAEFNPRTIVYLPPEARGIVNVTNVYEVKILPKLFSAQRIEVEVQAGQPAFVTIAQAYYHPWRAFVDDRPARLWKANYTFQALEIPGGQHKVELVYVDRAFQCGAGISLASLAICCFGRFRLREKLPR